MRLPGMNIDPRRMALMNALKRMEAQPADLPSHRSGFTPDHVQPSLDDIRMMRQSDPLEEHVTSEDFDPSFDYYADQQAGAYDPQMLLSEDLPGPNPLDTMKQPQPGTPEFYEWLMNRVG